MPREAKKKARQVKDTIAFWFRSKYRLTINDPRYLEMTEYDMMVDYYADFYVKNPKAMDEVSDDDFNADEIIQAMSDGEDWEEL